MKEVGMDADTITMAVSLLSLFGLMVAGLALPASAGMAELPSRVSIPRPSTAEA